MRSGCALLLPLLLFAAAPEQPIPFSHKQHAAAKLTCKDCHAMPPPGELMTFPSESKCMSCHATIGKEKASIAKLAAFAARKQPVPWVRVYRTPSYVFWSHSSHLAAGAQCSACHGPVAERDALSKESDISMGACMSCHRAKKASLDCNYCHQLQQ